MPRPCRRTGSGQQQSCRQRRQSRAPEIVDQHAVDHETAEPPQQRENLCIAEMMKAHGGCGTIVRFGWLVGEGVLLKQSHRRVTRSGKLSARNVNRVAGHFQAGEVQRDAVRARPPTHRQRNVTTSRADVEDAQGGAGMALRRFGG
jgi:hypothetical protein